MASIGVVSIRSGVPGLGKVTPDAEHEPYPTSTIDVVKILREKGYDVSFDLEEEDRQYAGHFAADVWLPILEIAGSLLLGIAGNLMSQIIIDYIGEAEARRSVLHVEYIITRADGSSETFRADGTGEHVLRALDEFEERIREDES